MTILDALSKYLDIDTRRVLDIPPRKLDTRYFEYLVSFRRPYIYMKDIQTLHQFTRDYYISRRPVVLSECDETIAQFDGDCSIEVVSADGRVYLSPSIENFQIDTKFLKIV